MDIDDVAREEAHLSETMLHAQCDVVYKPGNRPRSRAKSYSFHRGMEPGMAGRVEGMSLLKMQAWFRVVGVKRGKQARKLTD